MPPIIRAATAKSAKVFMVASVATGPGIALAKPRAQNLQRLVDPAILGNLGF
jgi:hypothetical protein